MKKVVPALLVLGLGAMLAFAHDHAGKNELTGWLTDSHCAAKHAKPGGEKCVKGCIEKGAKLTFASEDGEHVYTVANPDKVAGHEGHKVKVSGKIDREAKTIEIAEFQHLEGGSGGGHSH